MIGISNSTKPPEKTTNPTPPPVIIPVYNKKPIGDFWPSRYNSSNRINLGDWLIKGCWGSCSYTPLENETEYEGYDGWYNNMARKDLGAIGK